MVDELVRVKDLMQQGYVYKRTEPMGRNFDPVFKPELSPAKMLELGVFGGKYMRDCVDEFPNEWFINARFATNKRDPELNFFGVNASLPLKHWKEKGWIYQDDPRGWFQWYCRYYSGRRIDEEDSRQIGRWKAIRRHLGAIRKNCKPRDLDCRRKQRQALLHWAYDSRKI